eukprot:3835011-Rhodomonas_salina.5
MSVDARLALETQRLWYHKLPTTCVSTKRLVLPRAPLVPYHALHRQYRASHTMFSTKMLARSQLSASDTREKRKVLPQPCGGHHAERPRSEGKGACLAACRSALEPPGTCPGT